MSTTRNWSLAGVISYQTLASRAGTPSQPAAISRSSASVVASVVLIVSLNGAETCLMPASVSFDGAAANAGTANAKLQTTKSPARMGSRFLIIEIPSETGSILADAFRAKARNGPPGMPPFVATDGPPWAGGRLLVGEEEQVWRTGVKELVQAGDALARGRRSQRRLDARR